MMDRAKKNKKNLIRAKLSRYVDIILLKLTIDIIV
jgi:hypothetical protein